MEMIVKKGTTAKKNLFSTRVLSFPGKLGIKPKILNKSITRGKMNLMKLSNKETLRKSDLGKNRLPKINKTAQSAVFKESEVEISKPEDLKAFLCTVSYFISTLQSANKTAFLKSTIALEANLLEYTDDSTNPFDNPEANKLVKKFIKTFFLFVFHFRVIIANFGFDSPFRSSIKNFTASTLDSLVFLSEKWLLPCATKQNINNSTLRKQINSLFPKLKLAKYNKMFDIPSINALLDSSISNVKLYSSSNLRNYLKCLHSVNCFICRNLEKISFKKLVWLFKNSILYHFLQEIKMVCL